MAGVSAKLKLKRFNMNMIKDDKVVVLIGKRETGKSFLVKDLLYYHRDIPIGCIISGTEGANKFYSSIFPSSLIHGEFKDAIVKNYLDHQKQAVVNLDKSPGKDIRSFFILDDCLYDQSWTRNKDVRALFMNGRHYKTMFIITMQYALGIPPNLRTNIDFVFILRENFISNRKRIYEQYAGMFPSFEVFCQVMDQCTEDYNCLVINNNAKSNKIEDQVFWYKADAHDDFKLCSPKVWEWHNKQMLKQKQKGRTGTAGAKLRLDQVAQTKHKIHVDVEKIWNQSISGRPPY